MPKSTLKPGGRDSGHPDALQGNEHMLVAQMRNYGRRPVANSNATTGSGGVIWRNVLTLGSLTLLVAVEVIGAAIAGGWALAGLLDLGTTAEYAFMVIFAAIAIWWTVKFVRAGIKLEPFTKR